MKCGKTCLVGLWIRAFAREKLHERFSASAVFPVQNRTNKLTNNTCFALITHLLSIRATTSWKKLMNNEFKAQTFTGNRTGNSRCHVLALRALNMSFGQSARLKESRCVVLGHVYWTWCKNILPIVQASSYKSFVKWAQGQKVLNNLSTKLMQSSYVAHVKMSRSFYGQIFCMTASQGNTYLSITNKIS